MRRDFCATLGLACVSLRPLTGDASQRRYFRLEAGREHFILMDSPLDNRRFVAVAKALGAAGFSVPLIMAADLDAGFLLLEDFGDRGFGDILLEDQHSEWLYALAVDNLVALHSYPSLPRLCDCAAYGLSVLLAEAELFVTFYLRAFYDYCPTFSALTSYRRAWLRALVAADLFADDVPQVFVMRDYHADNLMLLGERRGIQRCGLLDFQDALCGHRAYDLVSLLEDARRCLPLSLREQMFDRYRRACVFAQKPSFVSAYDILGAQRQAKCAGLFVRLCMRDGKAQYLAHIPRVIDYLSAHLFTCPSLAGVRHWLAAECPLFLKDHTP